MKDALADALLPVDAADQLVCRVGTVTDNSPCEVNLAGQDGLSASHLASYTPVIADVVLVLQTKTDLIILGQIISGG